MGTHRLFFLAARSAAVLPILVVSACATTGSARSATTGAAESPTSGAAHETVAERGPRVQIWTADDFHTGDRVRTSFRLDDDAYVIVVNVGRDGYANVIFPESPEDDGFMRGGRTYRLPPFFPGFAGHFRSAYGRLYTATSAYDDVYDRYAGYVFVIASWRPMHFQLSEALGLWDNYRLAAHEERLEPYVVMHRFADQLVSGRSRDYTARFARYAAFERRVGRAGSFASCSAHASVFGGFPVWAFGALSRSWIPVYGLGLYSFGAPRCGFGYGIRLVGFRPPVRPIVTPPGSPPVQPTPPPVSRDSVSPPRKPPRPPVAAPDSGQPKVPRGRRVDVAVEDDPIVDVTRDTRERSRRGDPEMERARRALNRERRHGTTDGWRRTTDERRDNERYRASRRAEESRDVERARSRATVDDDSRARAERPRSEPRQEAPPRQEPRAEPRQEARPQPPPRNDPPPRSEPVPRSEPRSERPAKPPERQ